jgi:hypothetical protein
MWQAIKAGLLDLAGDVWLGVKFSLTISVALMILFGAIALIERYF